MKALIIGAGQGKRLLPLTETTPKALVKIGGKSLFEWQVDALIDCGITDIVFVAGFNFEAVEEAAEQFLRQKPGCRIRIVHNPFHAITDNLVTCWAARGEMTGDFLHLNSDTLFSPPVLQTLLSSPTAPVTLAIDQKERYDDDDMKVSLAGTRLVDVGKTLAADTVNGESIGILLFREDGPRLYVEARGGAR